MSAHADEVGASRDGGDVEPAEGLHGVGVHERPGSALVHERHDGLEGLAHAGLVVDEHHRDEAHLLVEHVGERVEVDDATTVDGDDPPSGRQARLEHRRVLDGAAQDRPGAGRGAEDGEVVGLGAAAREHDVSGARTEQNRELLPGVVEGRLRRSARRAWLPDGLPKRSARNGSIAATASAHIGVVAAWSR